MVQRGREVRSSTTATSSIASVPRRTCCGSARPTTRTQRRPRSAVGIVGWILIGGVGVLCGVGLVRNTQNESVSLVAVLRFLEDDTGTAVGSAVTTFNRFNESDSHDIHHYSPPEGHHGRLSSAADADADATSSKMTVETQERQQQSPQLKLKPGTPLPSTTTTTLSRRIPRHIHLVHVSVGMGLPQLDHPNNSSTSWNQPHDMEIQTIPPNVLHNLQEWERLHTATTNGTTNPWSWTVTLWNNTRIRQEFPTLTHGILSRLPLAAWSSDIVRYAILERYGGIYVDTDIFPFRSLDSLLCEAQSSINLRQPGAFTVCERPHSRTPLKYQYNWTRYTECKNGGNAVIGSIPHHPALLEMVQVAVRNTQRILQEENDSSSSSSGPNRIVQNPMDLLSIAGPRAWTQVAKRYPNQAAAAVPPLQNITTATTTTTTLPQLPSPSVDFLHSQTFFPCFTQRKKQDCVASNFRNDTHIFAMHTWSNSWKG